MRNALSDLFVGDQLATNFLEVYKTDKPALVRVLFVDITTLGQYVVTERDARRSSFSGNQNVHADVKLFFAVTYIMEMSILCVDASIKASVSLPGEKEEHMRRRVLETHEFPDAIRRALVIHDETKALFLGRVQEMCGEAFKGA
jgi:hypothetical protein